MRVVSLVPSLTETLFDLGAGDAVAGITDFCIFPAGLTLPRLGGTKKPRLAQIPAPPARTARRRDEHPARGRDPRPAARPRLHEHGGEPAPARQGDRGVRARA